MITHASHGITGSHPTLAPHHPSWHPLDLVVVVCMVVGAAAFVASIIAAVVP
jgi:hypothetical protein